MARKPQTWECPVCNSRYESPMQVLEVLCPKPHPAKTGRQMALVVGEPLNRTESKGRRNVSSGKV